MREMDCIRNVVGIVIVVHEEVVNVIVFCAINTNRVDELVDSEAAHEAQFRIAKAVVVNDICRIGDEMAEQRAGEQPLSHSGLAALDVAERDVHQADLCIVAIE